MIREKDSRGMARLYTYFHKRLKAAAVAMIKNIDIAEDIALDLLCHIFDTVERYGYVDNPNAWLYRSIKNAVINYVTRNQIVIPDDDIVENYSIDYELEHKLEFNEALLHFNKRERQVLVLYYAYGYTYEEIAEVLQISSSTVKRDLNKTRTLLKFYLKK